MSRQEVKKELMLFAATILVIAGSSSIPMDGNITSIKKVSIGAGLILLGVLVYILRGYYKKKIG
ncbi:hypothetical protein AKJ56_00995 [candidate division MSBL1 archaeon SCGC-AAA382N08]|uniref:Uncharacterized protein n=1 Tax=candidate division MSBL1 archaeon SCGC-AAA382N08 TaxID=1698285 RepID=A0A133VQ27_9EURY|nr:hypothetical protein AKJ56_00995 [candidate division MSBL1 archaeon SCGC-AAA382N08]